MERLQSALKKARDARGGPATAPVAAPTPAPDTAEPVLAPPRPSPSGDESKWIDTAPFDPDYRHLIRNRIVTAEASEASNSFDMLRTKIFLMMQRNNWSRLAITSPTKGCGKSTLACNLAMGLTRQSDIRAIVIEADLRRPVIAKMIGFEPREDVASVLTGAVPLERQGVRLGSNVILSAARRSMRDPTSVLLNRAFGESLARIEATFAPDLLILDLPPFLETDDCRAILANVDCAMIVARSEETTLGQIDTTEKEIAEITNVLGVVLNSCRHTEKPGGYGGYYGSA